MMPVTPAEAARVLQPRQAADVHAENARDQRDRQQRRGHHRQDKQVAVGGFAQPSGDLFLHKACPLLHKLDVLADGVDALRRLMQPVPEIGIAPRRQARQRRRQRSPIRAHVATQARERASHASQLAALVVKLAGQDVVFRVVDVIA